MNLYSPYAKFSKIVRSMHRMLYMHAIRSLADHSSVCFGIAAACAVLIACIIFFIGGSVYGALASTLLTFVALPLLPRKRRLRTSLWTFIVLLGFVIIVANTHSIPSVVHVSVKLCDPGSLALFPSVDEPLSEGTCRFGMGATALAAFVSTNSGRDKRPLIVWRTEAWPDEWQDKLDTAAGMPTLITCGPREWLETGTAETVPFLTDIANVSEGALETRIQLLSDAEQGNTFTWTTYMNAPSGFESIPDWSDDSLGCVCRGNGVASYTVSGDQVGELVIESAPAAVIPGSRQSFWVEHIPNGEPVRMISLKTIDSESPRLLEYTFDSSRSLFREGALENIDIWRELTTDRAAQIVLQRKMTTERGAFLLLGRKGELRVDNEVIRTFDGSFFAIVEPWGAYRSHFQVSCAVLSFVVASGNLSCDCPLLWLYNTKGDGYGSCRIVITDTNGVLRIGNTQYPFEEYDSVELTLEKAAFKGRRTTPNEYVIAGSARKVALNGEPLVECSHWSRIPSTLQNVIFAVFSAALMTAFSTLMPTIRRTTRANRE